MTSITNTTAPATIASGLGERISGSTRVAKALASRAAPALSLVAASLHLWSSPGHFREWWVYGAFFLAAAMLQGLYGVAVLRWPAKSVYLAGVFLNLALASFYVVSSVSSMTPSLHAGHSGSFGTLDLWCVSAEAVLVVVLVLLAGRGRLAGRYLSLAALLALSTGLALHLVRSGTSGSVGTLYWLETSVLLVPVAALALAASTCAARRLSKSLYGDSGAGGFFPKLAWAIGASSLYAAFSAPYATPGGAGVVLGSGFVVLLCVAFAHGAPWERRTVDLRRPRFLTVAAGAVAGIAVLAGPSVVGGLGASAEAQSVPGACDATSYDRSYDVAAINADIPFNRWGDVDPDGQIFVLQGDKEATKNWSKPLEANPANDPAGNRRLRPRPLVIRANVGECVKVDLRNELNARQWGGRLINPRVSMQVSGMAYDAQTSDGANLGYNDDTTVGRGESITYFWKAPDEEGLHLFRDQGATSGEEEDAGSTAHGLYGAVAVEPANSTWTDPETGEPVYAGDRNHDRITKASGDPYVDADIHPAGAPSFRETVQLAQDYNEVQPGLVGHGFNYGTEPQRNRERAEFLPPDGIGEEVSLSSWMYGDPALVKLASGPGPWLPNPEDTANVEDCNPNGYAGFDSSSCYVANVTHAYPGDPTKIRYAMAGVAETHVFHMHAHQWLANHKKTATFDPRNPNSATIDSQTFGPGETFTADLLYGAGSQPGTVGDSIFHCHLYPHFAEGFWSLFRVHDVREDGSGELPDGTNVRNVEPLPDRTAQTPPAPTADNPGFPRFIPGQFGWRAPQPPDSIFESSGGADDPATVAREDLSPAERIVAGETIPLEKRQIEQNVQSLNYGGATPKPGAPLTDPCPDGAREITYNVSVLQRDVVYNEAGWHDTQGRFLVLDKDVDRMLQKNPDGTYKHQPEPLFIRVNAGDCVNFNLTNLLPNWFGNDAFVRLAQTNMMGQHIHLVKFDVLASDGSSNGWNYQQAAFTSEQAEFNKNVLAGTQACNRAEGCRVPRPADWNASWDGGAQPGQTISERWYADYELRTVFSHDHHFAAVDQNRGQFAGLLVEPERFDFRNPRTGEFYAPVNNAANGPVCGQACEGDAVGAAMDVIGPGPGDDFREFGLAIQDFVSLTRAGGDPQNRADVLVGPNEPEHYPDEDPGIVGVNYRNAPFPLRQEKNGRPVDPAYTFSSTVHGDPETPVLQAYSEDRVQIRLIQGSQEHQHVFSVNGMRWREDPFDASSPLSNAQDIGISEAFNFQVPRMTCGSNDSACAGDYLYSSTNVDDLYMGMWGILRARGKQVPSLLPLPDNASPTEPTVPTAPTTTVPNPEGQPLTSTGLAPPEANSPGTPCPTGAPVKQYNVVAMEAEIQYNKHGDNDPYGLIYALAGDEAAIRAGEKKPEPLVLRANEGDCIEVRLTNKLTQGWLQKHGTAGTDGDAMQPLEPDTGTPAGLRVSLHPQLVRYDVRGSDGTAVGYNRDQTVAPGDSKLYRWYADDPGRGELGATNLTDFGDVRGHRHHGLFAGLNIEPRGSTYHDPATGAEIRSGVSADIRVPGPDNDFREFTAFFQDGLNIRDASGAPIEPAPDPGEPPGPANDHIDQGEKGFNYANAPFARRLGAEATEATETNPIDGGALANVFSSGEHGDPDTPVFRAYAGDDVRMRVLQGADKQRQHAFQLGGHSWREQAGNPESPLISTQGGFSVGRALNVELPSAGNGFVGDYRYGDAMFRHNLSGGLWGIMRLYPRVGPAQGLSPTPIPAIDNPRAGGHPILPLEISATQSALNLRAEPSTVDVGGSTTLSGSLTLSGGEGLSGRKVVIEEKPLGATSWRTVPNGELTTGANGSFGIPNLVPGKTADYRATFAGQPGVGISGSTSQTVRVEVEGSTAVELSSSAPAVVFGRPVTLSGILFSGDAPLPGKRVVVEHKPHGAAGFAPAPGQPSGGVLTGGDGRFVLAGVVPQKNTEYRAAFAGETGLAAAESAPAKVNVQALVSVRTSAPRVKVGRAIVISGAVAPAHAGAVRVSVRGGPRPVVRNVALVGSRYTLRFVPPRAGVYTVQVSFPGDADHAPGASPARSFRAVR